MQLNYVYKSNKNKCHNITSLFGFNPLPFLSLSYTSIQKTF